MMLIYCWVKQMEADEERCCPLVIINDTTGFLTHAQLYVKAFLVIVSIFS